MNWLTIIIDKYYNYVGPTDFDDNYLNSNTYNILDVYQVMIVI